MNKLSICLLLLISLASCQKENTWSNEDKQAYKIDCLAASHGLENAEAICDCGLEITMQKFASKKEASLALQQMSAEELEDLFKDCY